MPLPIDDDEPGPDDTGADILGEVQLISFKAQPASIGPFGASVLSWEVEGPPGFQLKLRGQGVPKTGDMVVQPAATTSFALSAHARQASRTLGHVVVNVDTSGCETFEPLLNPKQTIKGTLKVGVDNDPDVYFRIDPSTIGFGKTPQPWLPIVKFAPGRISFSLRLSKHQDWFPDPSVDIDASFGLTVTDGELVAIGEQVSVSVDVPFWAWAIPGAIPGLAIALDGGRERARESAHNSVQGLVQLMNFLTVPSKGKRSRTVRIDDGNNGAGVIEVTACPYNLLLDFAAISATKAVIAKRKT
jgi:hypothetical protein